MEVTSVLPLRILTVAPASTPVSVRTLALVPVPWTSVAAVGAVVSILPVTAFDAAEVLPAASFAVAVIACVPIDKAVAGTNDHVPSVRDATAVPKTVVPSKTVTVAPFSAVPLIVGLVESVELFDVVAEIVAITGAFGAVVSILPVTAFDAAEVLPAASVTVAVRLNVSDPVKAPTFAV